MLKWVSKFFVHDDALRGAFPWIKSNKHDESAKQNNGGNENVQSRLCRILEKANDVTKQVTNLI